MERKVKSFGDHYDCLQVHNLHPICSNVSFNSYPQHPPGHPRAFAQKKFPSPGHLTVNFFPALGHLTTPRIFKMCTVYTV